MKRSPRRIISTEEHRLHASPIVVEKINQLSMERRPARTLCPLSRKINQLRNYCCSPKACVVYCHQLYHHACCWLLHVRRCALQYEYKNRRETQTAHLKNKQRIFAAPKRYINNGLDGSYTICNSKSRTWPVRVT